MAFFRKLLHKGPRSTKPVQTNGAPASMSTEEATSQMAGMTLDGEASADGREIATFALS